MDTCIKILSKHSSNKGMTLVEVLVSLVILTILVIAFTNLIGWNFINIFNIGEKSKAIAKAMERTDHLNDLVWSSVSEVEAIARLEDINNGWVGNVEEYVLPKQNPADCVYSYVKVDNKLIDGQVVNGYEVSVRAYYNNFKYHVELDSFILQPPEKVGS